MKSDDVQLESPSFVWKNQRQQHSVLHKAIANTSWLQSDLLQFSCTMQPNKSKV